MIPATTYLPADETPTGFLLERVEINAGVARQDATEAREPSATLTFVEVIPLVDAEGEPIRNTLGQPGYRTPDRVGVRRWQYVVTADHLASAIANAAGRSVAHVLGLIEAQGIDLSALDLPAVVQGYAMAGYPDTAIRQAAEWLEEQRLNGSIEFRVNGTPPDADG